MKLARLIVLFALGLPLGWGQPSSVPRDPRWQTKGTGASPPGSCVAGRDVWIKSDTLQVLYCFATNSWTAVGSGLPSQGGNSGKFISTNGTTASWDTPAKYITVTFSATPTFTCTTGANITFLLTLTGDVTSSTLAGCSAGQHITFRFCQDAGGNHTLVFPTNVYYAADIAAGARQCTTQEFVFDGTNAQALPGPAGVSMSTGGPMSDASIQTPTPDGFKHTITIPTSGADSTTTLVPGGNTVIATDCTGTGHVLKVNADGTVTCSADAGGSSHSEVQVSRAAAGIGTGSSGTPLWWITTGNTYCDATTPPQCFIYVATNAQANAVTSFHVPSWWTVGSVNLALTLSVGAAGTYTFTAESYCYGGGASKTPTYNGAQTMGSVVATGADETWQSTLTGLTMTGCAAGRTLLVRITITAPAATNANLYELSAEFN